MSLLDRIEGRQVRRETKPPSIEQYQAASEAMAPPPDPDSNTILYTQGHLTWQWDATFYLPRDMLCDALHVRIARYPHIAGLLPSLLTDIASEVWKAPSARLVDVFSLPLAVKVNFATALLHLVEDRQLLTWLENQPRGVLRLPSADAPCRRQRIQYIVDYLLRAGYECSVYCPRCSTTHESSSIRCESWELQSCVVLGSCRSAIAGNIFHCPEGHPVLLVQHWRW